MDSKQVWILNHYATNQFANRGGRHHAFAIRLKALGYEPTVICASTRHGRGQLMPGGGEAVLDGVKYVFLRTPSYKGTIGRLWNMLSYYMQARSLTKLRAREQQIQRPRRTLPSLAALPRPDLVYASSVHPLTLVAGLRIGRVFEVPVVCEVRDLWPLSIETYLPQFSGSVLMRPLYAGEKWIYEKADELVFTMEGGAIYIENKGWSSRIPESKIHYVNNGVDISLFDANAARNTRKYVEEYASHEAFTIVYAGSIRRVNNVGALVDLAEALEQRGVTDVKILIYGEGDQRSALTARSSTLDQIEFRGPVEKSAVPAILTSADALLLHGEQGVLTSYGPSMNKLFEYMASSTPIISDCEYGFDPIIASDSGLVRPQASAEELADAVEELRALSPAEREAMGERARAAAHKFDYDVLSEQLAEIFEKALRASGNSSSSRAS